ncbi:hypothetical protein [Paenibacillus harenae]|uniref:Zinc ribbon domain-containing protein n=1 Tax=Paenibacillus harenae TaxID=306543 RepID=A0ABT9U4U2_PAEHA|nr:hypothetical protein [Paenibacillus harenae]MDQ0114667.1 hypothetical protein [Paenibacillus harenae]
MTSLSLTAMHIQLMFSWLGFGATAIVLLVALLLLAGMIFFIRIASSGEDKHAEIREMVETLFGTPAHLRPTQPGAASPPSSSSAPSSLSKSAAPFSEPCPACGETVTENDAHCPSCDLRLL